MDLIESLHNFYSHYDPDRVPPKEKLEEFAKGFAGKERDLWDNLYKQFEPDKPVSEKLHSQLATLKNPFAPTATEGAKKKSRGSSPASGVAAKTGLGVTPEPITVDGIAPQVVSPAELEAQKGAVNINANDTVTPSAQPITQEQKAQAEQDVHNLQVTMGDKGIQKRSQDIADTAFDLQKLAAVTGKDYTVWRDKIGAVLNDKTKPEAVRDVLALREAYNAYKETGTERGGDYRSDDHKLPVSERNGITRGIAMNDVWNRLSEAEAKLRNTNPGEWDRMNNAAKEEYFGKLQNTDPRFSTKGDVLLEGKGLSVADKQLFATALAEGITGLSDVSPEHPASPIGMGESYPGVEVGKIEQQAPSGNTELAEAKLRNEIAHGQQKIAVLRQQGDESNAKLAEREYGKLEQQANNIRNARHAENLGKIDAIKKNMERYAPDTMAYKAGKAALKPLEEAERGFIDPAYEFGNAVMEHKEGMAAVAAPTDTPAQAMRKYLGTLIFEKKMLDSRINEDEGSAGWVRELGGLTVRGWNEDENRAKELGQKIAALSKVVLLNEMPETDKGFLNSAKGGFVNTLYGASTLGKLVDTNTAQGKAMAVAEMLQSTGIDPDKAINPQFKEQFDADKAGPQGVSGWFTGEHIGGLTGMLGAMAAMSSAGSGILKGLGTGTVLAEASAAAKAGGYGQKFGNVLLKSLHKGAEYEITGTLFKDQEHFFNFTTGLAGGAAEGVVGGLGTLTKAGAMKSVDLIKKVFGVRASEATRIIMDSGKTLREEMSTWVGRRVSGAAGAGFGQFTEGNFRAAQQIGGESSIKGTIDGLMKLYSDPEVSAKYHEHLKEQFGGTWNEQMFFFADMMVIGSVLHGKEHGDVIAKEMRRTYNDLKPEQQAIVDNVVESAIETGDAVGEGVSQVHEDAKKEIDKHRQVIAETIKKRQSAGENKEPSTESVIDSKAEPVEAESVAENVVKPTGEQKTFIDLNTDRKGNPKEPWMQHYTEEHAAEDAYHEGLTLEEKAKYQKGKAAQLLKEKEAEVGSKDFKKNRDKYTSEARSKAWPPQTTENNASQNLVKLFDAYKSGEMMSAIEDGRMTAQDVVDLFEKNKYGKNGTPHDILEIAQKEAESKSKVAAEEPVQETTTAAGNEPETQAVSEPLEEPVVSPAPDQNSGTPKPLTEPILELGQTKPKVHEKPEGQEPIYSFKINGHEFFVQNDPFEGKDYYSQVEKNANGDWKTIPDYDNARSTRKQAIDTIVDNWQEEVDARNKRNAGKEKPLEVEKKTKSQKVKEEAIAQTKQDAGEVFDREMKSLRDSGAMTFTYSHDNVEVEVNEIDQSITVKRNKPETFQQYANPKEHYPYLGVKERMGMREKFVEVVNALHAETREKYKVEAEKKAADVPAAEGTTRISIKTESGADLDLDIDLGDLFDEPANGDITVDKSKEGEKKPQDALDAHMKDVESAMGGAGVKEVRQAAAEIIAGKPEEIVTKGMEAEKLKAVLSAVEFAKQVLGDASKGVKTKRNRAGKTTPVRNQKPAETIKEVAPAVIDAGKKPTPENKSHLEAVNDQVGRNAERSVEPPKQEGKPKPIVRNKAGKSGEMPEGVEEQFTEAHVSGKRTAWRKANGKWQWRTHKPGTHVSEKSFTGEWQEAKGKDVEKAERMSNMEATTLDVVNSAKELAAAFKDLVTLKAAYGGEGRLLSSIDFGLIGNTAKVTYGVVKLGLKVAKALFDKGELAYGNWRKAMEAVAGDSIPKKDMETAWNEAKKEHGIAEEKKTEAPKAKEEPKVKEKPADAGKTKAEPTVETPEQKQIRELKEENARLKSGADKKKKTKKKAAATTTQAATEPTTTTSTSAETGETGTSGIWTTLSKYKGTKANGPHLDKVLERMNNTYNKVSHEKQFEGAMADLGWVKGADGKQGHFEGNPLEKLPGLIDGKSYLAKDFSRLLEKRLVMMDILGKSMQGLEAAKKSEIENGGSPEAIREIEDNILAGMQATEQLATALKAQGTIGGQGTSFIGFWRNMYTHADALIAAKIMQTNRDLQYDQKLQDRVSREMEAMREIREREANNVSNDEGFNAAVDGITSKSEGKSTKASTPAGEPKKTIAERKADIKAELKKANKNLMNSLSSGGLAGIEVLPLLVKYGKILIEEKIVNFKAWAAKMREDNGKISDDNLQKIWKGKDADTGLTLKEHAELELKKAASAPEGKAKRKESLRQKIQKELKSTDPEDLITRLEENVGLTKEEALLVAKEHESPANIAKIEQRKAEAAKNRVKELEGKQQAYIDKVQKNAEESHRLQLEGKVSDALKEFKSKQGPKGMEELLKKQGLDDAQVSEVMAARGAEFTKAGVDALKKASEGADNNKKAFDALLQSQGLTDRPANEKSLRSKVQKAFDDHFRRKDDSMSLKERLMKDVGLTDAQAETILKAEDYQLKEREKEFQSKIDNLIDNNNKKIQEAADAKRQAEVNRGVRQAISDHFQRDNIEKRLQTELGLSPENAKQVAAIARRPLWNGKGRTPKEMSATITEDTGLPADKVKEALDLIEREKSKTFQDRIMEHTGVDQAQADVLAVAFKKAFDKRARTQIEARAKKLRTKPKGRRTSVRPMNDVDRALETITDRDLTDEDMNNIFKERLGFMDPLTADQSAYVRNLGDQLANSKQGGILEHDAARHLDRFFDQFLPKDTLLKRAVDVWQGLWIAGMLSGVATTMKNVLSAATIVAFSPVQNLFNWSEWLMALRESGGLKGLKTTEGRNKALRLSPLMGAVVKYKALGSGHVWATARRTAADIWLEGYMGTKFSEIGETALGRQMTVGERRAYGSFKAEMDKAKNIINSNSTPAQIANFAARQVQHTGQAYAWAAKWSGRNLQMQDVFIRTIATEMQLADAFRRSSVEATKAQMAAVGFDTNKSYAAWVNYNLSQSKHPNFKAAVKKAVGEVLEHQVALSKITQAQADQIAATFNGNTRENGLPEKGTKKVAIAVGIPRAGMAQAKRFVRVRTRELLMDGFTHEGKEYEGLAISEQAREAAHAIARSQIFTEKRAGVATMISDGVNKLKSTGAFANFVISPIIPFTTIISNMVATMADYNPISGVPRAHGGSLIDLISLAAGKNKKGESKFGSSSMGIDPKADWMGWRLSNMMRDPVIDKVTGKPIPGKTTIDQRYYEQMGRSWTGINTLIGLAMMTSGNPMGAGIGITYAPDMNPFNDTGDEYSVFFNGQKMFSYKEYPFLAAPFAFLGAWHSFGRNPEEFGGADGFAKRLAYSMWSSESMALKMSVGEGAANAINMLADGYNSFTQKGSSSGEQWYNTFGKPYLKSMTKALPWRWSAVEQTVGLFDPSKYSTKMINESMAYFFEGPFYGRATQGYKDVDIFGDPMVGNPILATIPFVEGYKNDVAKRPYRKFLSERDISLDPPQNSDTVRFSDDEDSILGTDYRDYNADEWAFFKAQAGENFKKSLEKFMEEPGLIPDGKDPDGFDLFKWVPAEEKIAYMDSHISIKDAQKDKPMSQTEKKVRDILAMARLSARRDVLKKFDKQSSDIPVPSELIYKGGNQY